MGETGSRFCLLTPPVMGTVGMQQVHVFRRVPSKVPARRRRAPHDKLPTGCPDNAECTYGLLLARALKPIFKVFMRIKSIPRSSDVVTGVRARTQERHSGKAKIPARCYLPDFAQQLNANSLF